MMARRSAPPKGDGPKLVLPGLEHSLNWIIDRYSVILRFVLQHQPATLVVTLGTLALTIFLFLIIPKGFFPVQDTV